MHVKKSYFLKGALAVSFINTAIAVDNQYFIRLDGNDDVYSSRQDAFLNECFQPITFSQEGFRTFLKETINRKEYSTEFLPYNLGHLDQILKWATQHQNGNIHAAASLRLFTNKIKATPCMTINPIITITEKFPDYLKPYFIDAPNTIFTRLKSLVKGILFKAFNNHFDFFKSEPIRFFDTLSADILAEVKESELVQAELDKEQLRTMIMRFLETSLSKLIWSPIDQEEVWNSFKHLAGSFANLHEHEIIREDDLDDLLNSLVERFIHFLDLTGSDLSADTLAKMERELDSEIFILNRVAEQEEYLTTKRERMLDAIQATRAKVMARTQGIITEVIAY